MTAKRFKQINLPADIIDTKTSKIYHTMTGNDGEELCILLNTLHEEKELEHKRVNYLKKIVAENCPNSLLIQIQNDLEWIE